MIHVAGALLVFTNPAKRQYDIVYSLGLSKTGYYERS